jgi:DNA-binding XRE family transcriptional regulator
MATNKKRLAEITIVDLPDRRLSMLEIEAAIEDIGKHLVDLRKQRGMTQDDVKVKSGLTPKQIVELEKGRTNYTITSLMHYLRAVRGKIIIPPKTVN